MKRRFGLLLAALALAACALPFDAQPPQAGSAPTSPAIQPVATSPAASGTAPQASTPAATATPASAPTPAAAEPVGPQEPVDDPARLAAARPAQRSQVALAEAFKGIGDIPDGARTTPLDVKVGDVESFWVMDFSDNTNYQVSARLRYAGPVALMYVDEALEVDQATLEQAAKQFEQQIYPRDRALFGQERSPGVDGDPRLTILNTQLRGGVAAAYYSGADSVPKAVNRFSNERDMFVMGIPPGSPRYESTLAHEFQHMIEANVAPRSPLWFNEGMSRLAEDLNGYVDQSLASGYLANPDTQLTTFSQGTVDRALFGRHYGASQLFMRYFAEQYAGEAGLIELLKTDAGNNLDAFAAIAARKRPDITSFADIYADWALANLLNDPKIGDGRYAYGLLPGTAQPAAIQPQETGMVDQFGVDYYGQLQGPLTIEFDGADTVPLAGARPKDGRYAWWSNRGDDSEQTLTRAFDLRGAQRATLQFATWYELEHNFDYAFVAVSTDGGRTWSALKASTSTADDPQGHNYGNGITGISGAPGVDTDSGTRGQWIDEQVDLTPFAGKQILLRFWVVNDEGYNAPGMLIDDIRIPELSYADGAESGDGGWQAQGFVRTTGELAQVWALRLVRVRDGATAVEPVAVDGQGRASVRLADGERGVLAVIGATPLTTEPAPYSYTTAVP